jgi:RNA polymerase subunit RPABC4/transcription elongation factor Spt4
MLLGPFGLILAFVVVGDSAAVSQATELRSGTARKCPACAEIVKTEAKVCKHCGRDLPEIKTVPLHSAVVCEGCKAWAFTAVLQGDVKTCPRCGTAL